MYIFPYFDYMFWYIFPIFSFFCPIWSWKMIQNCGLIFDHSRCHGLMFDYVWVEPGVHFLSLWKRLRNGVHFPPDDHFFLRLGVKVFMFLFLFQVFHSFYNLIMICSLIPLLQLILIILLIIARYRNQPSFNQPSIHGQ